MAEISTLNGYKIKDKKAIRYYNTVADMKADITLKDGMHIKTKGYYNINDGGHGEYTIINDNTLVDDGGLVHLLSNGLKAKLINNKIVNVNQLGAYGDGEHDDTSVIQYAIDNLENIEFVGNKTYIVNGIQFSKYININGNDCTLKADSDCDYILKCYNTQNKYNGIIENITFDGNNKALDCIVNDNSFRRIYKNIVLNNPRVNGSGFHQINLGGGTRLESINGYQENKTLDTTFLKIEGADVNINMADYYGYKTGLYSNGNVQINQFHGYIYTTDELNAYENSKFIHLNGGRFTGVNLYPDTQQIWFYIENVGDYQIIGGESYHNPDLTDTLIAQTSLQKEYVVYTTSQEKVRRLHISNFNLKTPATIENIAFCNNYRYTFATSNISVSYESNIDFFDWYIKELTSRLTDIVNVLNSSTYTNNLKLSPDNDKIKITGFIKFNTSYNDTNNIEILSPKEYYSFIKEPTNFLVLPTLVGDDMNSATTSDVKFVVAENKLTIKKLRATDLTNKNVYLTGYVYLKNIK